MSKPAEKVEAPEKEKKTTLNKNKKATKPVDTSKYEGAGQCFKAKLIGFEDVSEAKGEKLCQVAIAKLKAAVLALGEHKEKIVLNLTVDGISIFDEKKEVLLHRHELSIISYVARDIGDSRTFAYIINDENGKHRCVAIKTEKSADVPVACLKELFQALEEKRNQPEDGVEATETTNADGEVNVAEQTNGPLENNPTVDANKNLLSLENDFFGLELAAPSPPVQAQPNSDLTALLLDEVFGAHEVAPTPAMTSPKDSINLLSSPPTSPIKPPVVPQYQQLLASQFSGMEGNLSPLQNPSFSPKAYPMSQPSPFKAVLQAQNGWTSFEALSAPLAAPTPVFPSDLISPLGAVPQQPQTPQKQTPVAQPSNPIDPFSDLSFLNNLQSQPAKKPVTRTDFVKDPPKITLMDLVGQKRDSFGLPMHSSQQHLPTTSSGCSKKR